MNQFPDCPRCHKEWNRNYINVYKYILCDECDLAFHIEDNILSFVLKGYWVYWSLEANYSWIYPIKITEKIVLPYLPYDITLNKLKLYLTFL